MIFAHALQIQLFLKILVFPVLLISANCAYKITFAMIVGMSLSYQMINNAYVPKVLHCMEAHAINAIQR